MATPPPEATSVLKEEKPQLPPSPNGVSSDENGRTSAQAPGADAKSDAHTNGAGESAPVNGHNADKPSLSNGVNTTASPPKSPTLSSAETTKPATEGDEPKPSNTESTTADESKKDTTDEKPATNQPGSNGINHEHAAPKEIQTPQDTPKPSADPTPDQKPENKAQSPQESASVKTDLPHHPPTPAKPEAVSGADATAAAPPVPPLQTVDQEMRDAPDVPLSPTKLSRERERDPSDEPAAKRTKVESEGAAKNDFKVPKIPTPAPATPAQSTTNGASSMTKMQHKFLLKGVQSLKRMNDSRFYREPVDPIKMNIPHYPQIIQRPMDLGTIERQLKQNQYKTARAVIEDFYLMVQNALTFNGPDHLVAQEGQKLKATFDKQLVNLPKPDEVEEKKPKKVSTSSSTTTTTPTASAAAPKSSAVRREPRPNPPQPAARQASESQATTFALGPEGLPLIRRDSTNADGRPKRSIHPPKRDLPYSTKPKKKKYQTELRFCQEVLDEVYKTKHYNYAMPFYYPVDPVALNIPTYHSVIKKPMDLSTVQSKLKTGQYENSKEFELDIRQILKNCFKFNIPGDPTFMAGQKFEEVFNAKWSQKARYVEAHEPHPEHQSVDSSEEESDEEEEESDEDTEKLTFLQKQMAELSRQMEAIASKKKKTPPGSKKAGKSKSGKKDPSRKSGSMSLGKKDKKTSKPGKPEKARFVTYAEKQVISNGISSLPDKKMQEALKIIQSNVPSLKGTQETEIELDIDELPNDVLLMLLKFVKKNAPQVMEDEDIPVSAATNVPAPKPKKNKPMSKYEQEAQINMLESNLERFQRGGGGHSPDPIRSVEANESSDDDSEDDSEESEEE